MTSQQAQKVSIGVAGWSYEDWNGYVYPRGTRDKLRFLASYLDMIEINSSFYRTPQKKTVESWLSRTSDLPQFFFAAKLSSEITHGGVMDHSGVTSFINAFAPMSEEGKLKHVLAQFRWDFDNTSSHRDHLAAIQKNFAGLANVTLELRHNSWQTDDALAFLSDLGVTVANLDYPTTRNSFSMRTCPVGQHAYLRLHGRNSKAWFSKDAGRDETYNYLYSDNELDDIVDRAVELAGMSKSLTLVANNHYQGKEVLNALEIKSRITGEKLDVPPDLEQKYPRLKKIKRPRPSFPEQGDLFG